MGRRPLAHIERRRLRAGQFLCRQGAPPGPAYLVLGGCVRVVRETPDDQPTVLASCGPGALVGELAAVLGRNRSAGLQAEERAEVLVLPRTTLLELAQRHPGLTRVLTHALSDRAGLDTEQLEELIRRLGLPKADGGALEPTSA